MGQYGRRQEVVVVTCGEWGYIKCYPQGLGWDMTVWCNKKRKFLICGQSMSTHCIDTSTTSPQPALTKWVNYR